MTRLRPSGFAGASPVTSTMALILQHDLQRRGHELSLGDCEAVLARVLEDTATLSRRLAIAAVEMPLCPQPSVRIEPEGRA